MGKYALQDSLELSEGGMLLRSESKFAKNQRIVVTVIIPSGGTVVAAGEIIYINPPAKGSRGHSYGVKYSELERNLRRIIRNYVSAKTEEESENGSIEFGKRETRTKT